MMMSRNSNSNDSSRRRCSDPQGRPQRQRTSSSSSRSLRNGASRQSSLVALLVLFVCLCHVVHVVHANVQEHTLLRKLQMDYPDFEPRVMLDIGANRGMFATTMRSLYPHAKLILLEASQAHNVTLADWVQKDNEEEAVTLPKSERYIQVLSGRDGEVLQFFDHPTWKGNTGNSLFRENSQHFKDMVPISVHTLTVDTIVAQSPMLRHVAAHNVEEATIDLIKIDVQGAELIVLNGAHRALEQATFVQFEASTVEFNQGGACVHEIDSLLRSHGFYFYEAADSMYHDVFGTKGVGQYDALYVKPTSPRLPQYLKDGKPKYCKGRRSDSAAAAAATSRQALEVGAAASAPSWSSGSTGIPNTSITSSWYLGFYSGLLASFLLNGMWSRSRKATTTKRS